MLLELELLPAAGTPAAAGIRLALQLIYLLHLTEAKLHRQSRCILLLKLVLLGMDHFAILIDLVP